MSKTVAKLSFNSGSASTAIRDFATASNRLVR